MQIFLTIVRLGQHFGMNFIIMHKLIHELFDENCLHHHAGLVFRLLGYYTGQTLLGAKVVAAMLMFATVSGILMALFLNTAGGAWDNAKKYIETGALGGKGSECHKAAVTGDT